jgi:hypothetical protein
LRDPRKKLRANRNGRSEMEAYIVRKFGGTKVITVPGHCQPPCCATGAAPPHRIALQQIVNRCKLRIRDAIRITFFGDGVSQSIRTNFKKEAIMKATTWLFAAAMSVSGLALAQSNAGVTTITDPAKIAEIERHAEQLKSGQPSTPMMDEQHGMRHHGMRHHGKRHHKKAMRNRAMKDKAPSDTPMAPEAKG